MVSVGAHFVSPLSLWRLAVTDLATRRALEAGLRDYRYGQRTLGQMMALADEYVLAVHEASVRAALHDKAAIRQGRFRRQTSEVAALRESLGGE